MRTWGEQGSAGTRRSYFGRRWAALLLLFLSDIIGGLWSYKYIWPHGCRYAATYRKLW